VGGGKRRQENRFVVLLNCSLFWADAGSHGRLLTKREMNDCERENEEEHEKLKVVIDLIDLIELVG
jgi:hypothetical protein